MAPPFINSESEHAWLIMVQDEKTQKWIRPKPPTLELCAALSLDFAEQQALHTRVLHRIDGRNQAAAKKARRLAQALEKRARFEKFVSVEDWMARAVAPHQQSMIQKHPDKLPGYPDAPARELCASEKVHDAIFHAQAELYRKFRRDRIHVQGQLAYDQQLETQAKRRKVDPAFQTRMKEFAANKQHRWEALLVGAERAKREVTLTQAQAFELFDKPCAYCKLPFEPTGYGIDRIDSSLGYSDNNCVAACATCNRGKNAFSARQFIQMCINVALECMRKSGEDVSETPNFADLPKFHPSDWHKLRAGAAARNITVELTREEFSAVQNNPCVYCARPGPSGLDRKDASVRTYSLESVVSCCGMCNRSKLVLSDLEFMAQCTAVYTAWRDNMEGDLVVHLLRQ
jgi:hypothetical protein